MKRDRERGRKGRGRGKAKEGTVEGAWEGVRGKEERERKEEGKIKRERER